MAGQMAGLARVIMQLHHQGIGFKARALIEAEGIGMIKMAGMDPKAIDRFGPGLGDCHIHQSAAKAGADGLFGQAEESEFAVGHVSEIEFENADGGFIFKQRVGFSLRIAEDGGQFLISHNRAGEPHIVDANFAEQSAISIKVV